MERKGFAQLFAVALIVLGLTAVFMVSTHQNPHAASSQTRKLSFQYDVSGCGDDSRSEVKRADMNVEAGGGINVNTTSDSIMILHELNYFCCAKLKLEAARQNSTIIVTEVNEGDVCKCICTYRVSAEIKDLQPGRYTVILKGVEMKHGNITHEGSVLWKGEVAVGSEGNMKSDAGQKEQEESGTAGAEKEGSGNERDGGEFCGLSTKGKCSSDDDCIVSGCSAQVCQSRFEAPVMTTCEIRKCYNAAAYGMKCKCVDGKCMWVKVA